MTNTSITWGQICRTGLKDCIGWVSLPPVPLPPGTRPQTRASTSPHVTHLAGRGTKCPQSTPENSQPEVSLPSVQENTYKFMASKETPWNKGERFLFKAVEGEKTHARGITSTEAHEEWWPSDNRGSDGSGASTSQGAPKIPGKCQELEESGEASPGRVSVESKAWLTSRCHTPSLQNCAAISVVIIPPFRGTLLLQAVRTNTDKKAFVSLARSWNTEKEIREMQTENDRHFMLVQRLMGPKVRGNV